MKKSIVLVVLAGLLVLNGCDKKDDYSARFADLTKVHPDILFVSESSGSQHIYAVHDTARGDILDVSYNNFELDPTWEKSGRIFAYTNIHLFNSSTSAMASAPA